jgi:hypothetical protein
MTGDRDGQAPGKATLLVKAMDGILGTHRRLEERWRRRQERGR